MSKKKQAYFTKQQLRNEIFNVGKHEHKVFMPNEILEQLGGYVNEDGEYIEGFFDVEGKKVKQFKSSTHVAYAYAYVYLAHYMYRYCKHTNYVNYSEEKDIDEKMIKNILGFPAKSDAYTYITKKGGLLERLGYIRKESDIPTNCVLEDDMGNLIDKTRKTRWEIAFFKMRSDYPEIWGNTKNRKINYPIKGFYRYEYSEEEIGTDGTFFDIQNTHMIDIEVFIYCMADPELGVEGFYLYCFLLYQNHKFSVGYDCSYESFVFSTGLSLDTIKLQLKNLEQRNMITNDHKPFCIDRPIGKMTKANTYNVISVERFVINKSMFNLIPKQRKIDAEQYEKEIGWVGLDFDDDNLSDEMKNDIHDTLQHMFMSGS